MFYGFPIVLQAPGFVCELHMKPPVPPWLGEHTNTPSPTCALWGIPGLTGQAN
jgi:hypothetical protein